MKLISHRGNIDGQDHANENTLFAIEKCFSKGLDVEVDLWFIDGDFFLGHDSPQHKIDINDINNNSIWFHLKNIEILGVIKNYNIQNYFWHQEDLFTLTSSQKFWIYPGNFISSKDSIFVLPELYKNVDIKKFNFYGICTDQVMYYKKYLNI